MRGLFTLLFGAGMMLFMERAWAAGASRWLQARRLLWLMVFGLIHFFFIWFGDILFYYAAIGMVALLLVKWRSEEHTSELQSLMRISYAVFCLKKNTNEITST